MEGSSYLTVQEMMTWGKGAQFCPLLAEGDFTSLPMHGSRLPGRRYPGRWCHKPDKPVCVHFGGGGFPVGPTPLSKCSNLVARMKDAGEEHGEAGFES